MRYEVSQRDGKWIVWDTVNHRQWLSAPPTLLKKAVVGPFGFAVADSPRAIIEGRPYMFWAREEAQDWADTRNDLLGRSGAR